MLLAAALGLGIGWALRGVSTKKAQTGGSEGRTPSSELARAKSSFVPRNYSVLATRLAKDLSMSSGVTRWLYWLEALEKASLDDLPAFLRVAGHDAFARRVVLSRWIELNPRHLFDTMLRATRQGDLATADRIAEILFQEWPRRDLHAVILALNETESCGRLDAWRQAAAEGIIHSDIEQGLRLVAQWKLYTPSSSLTAIEKWTAANPKHAVEFTVANPGDWPARYAMMESMGKVWGRIDPAAALDFAAKRPAELSRLASAALKEWAGQNLNDAAAWLGQATPLLRNQLAPAFLEVWAKHDSASALAWSENYVSGASLLPAVRGVISGAAQKDISAAASLVSAMNPSAARAAAAPIVAAKWLPRSALADKPLSPEMLGWLGGLDGESIRSVLSSGSVIDPCPDYDPASLAMFVGALSPEIVPTGAYAVLAQVWAQRNPRAALDWAAGLPQEAALTAGAEAFAEWRLSQPEAAMEWFEALPAMHPGRQKFFESAIRALAHDSQAAEQLAHLKESERAAARQVIENMAMPAGRRSKLVDLLK